MGNSNSQQLQLDSEKYFSHRDRTWSHHKGHLIVPLTDASIQRKMLRNTENGQILQNEGTITQRRRSMRHPDEGMFALSPSRRTFSDSDLSRTPFDHVLCSNMDSFTQKSVIAVSPSKAKIKLRKNKGKAPEPPGLNLDPRDLQRRFVRSNSSLCPRTWENEFNSLNLDRHLRCDSRNRQHVPQKSRHFRPEANNLPRRQDKAVNGSQKPVPSLNSHRSAAPRTAAVSSNKRPPAKAPNAECSKPSKKNVTDTPRSSPVKPQFYFSNMDAVKKETTPTTNNSHAHGKPVSKAVSSVVKSAPVKAANSAASSASASLLHKTQVSQVEVTRPTTKPAKTDKKLPSTSSSTEETKQVNTSKELNISRLGAVCNNIALNNNTNSSNSSNNNSNHKKKKKNNNNNNNNNPKNNSNNYNKNNNNIKNNNNNQNNKFSSTPVSKMLSELPVKIESLPDHDAVKVTDSLPIPENLNVAHRGEKNGTGNRPTQNDNIVFKVNPNFIIKPGQSTVPQAATQILDELDATLENYSQISAERKSDDSDYCEPDDREMSPRASSNTQTATVDENNSFTPQIPPPKSLEMLFRPPSPRFLPPPTRFNGLDVTSQIELTSLPLADQPPTPPPIPSSWIKLRKNSLSSDENDRPNELDIRVHLRPCLPRRPLLASVPSRFSPTHAWKSLDPAGSHGDNNNNNNNDNDDKSLSDCEFNFSSSSSSSDEDRKEENLLKAHLSVDSGITDGYGHPHPQWTPKEDLIDTDAESTGGHDLSLCCLPSQARFTLPSMFLQNSTGVDPNWSFKSGLNSLQQKSQSYVYLPPPKSSESTVHNMIGHSNSNRSSTAGRNPPMSKGVSLDIESHNPLLEAERLREKEHKWMQKVEEEFRKRRERDRQQLQEQMQLFNSLTANIRPDPEGGCDQLQVR